MVKRRKIEAIIAKRQRVIGRMGLFGKNEMNYESNIGNKSDPNQPNNEYPLLNQKSIEKGYKRLVK